MVHWIFIPVSLFAGAMIAVFALALLERFCRDRLAQSTASKIQAAVAEAAILLESVDLVAAESLSFETQGRRHKTEALAVLAKYGYEGE